MKIFYLKMRNYRQYREVHIEFSTGSERSFTIIQGSNGAGKTTILNAITWCLYGEEMHLTDADSKKLPIANEKLSYELQPGQTEGVRVEIGLGTAQVEYMISRAAQIYKTMDGGFNVVADTDPSVLYLIRGDWKESDQPNFAVKALLPREISQFFLFDGEQLNRFFQKDSAERVKKGIVDVSQIDLLDTSSQHLRKVHNDLVRETPQIDNEVDEQKKLYEEAEQEIKACDERLRDLQEDLNGVEENIEEISLKLRESPDEEVRNLQQERETLEQNIKGYKSEVNTLAGKAAKKLREVGPIVYTYKALENALAKIQSKVDVGDLPPIVRKPFFTGLLDQQVCVCGTHLTEGSEARQNVQQRMNALKSVEDFMSKASEGRFRLANILDTLPEKIQQQQGFGRNIWQYEEMISEAQRRLMEISQKIEEDIDLEEPQLLEQQLQEYEKERQRINREIGKEQKIHSDLERKSKTALQKYHKALERDEKQQELLTRSEICSDALDILEQIRSELLTETREKIQQKTEEYFLRLIWKKATYESVKIDENYQLNIENIRGLPSLGTLSAGERQVLALAFTAALGTISGFDAPIVIDTPTGRISQEPRENIADALPNYLKDTQVTFLMTETEYTDSVRVRLAHRVGKEYLLEFDEDAAVTRVIQR